MIPIGLYLIQITLPTVHKNEWNKKQKCRSRATLQQYFKQNLKTWVDHGEIRCES